MRDLKYYAALAVTTVAIGVFIANVEGVGVVLPSWFPGAFIIGVLTVAVLGTVAIIAVIIYIERILIRRWGRNNDSQK